MATSPVGRVMEEKTEESNRQSGNDWQPFNPDLQHRNVRKELARMAAHDTYSSPPHTSYSCWIS